jgi:molybdopterin converting factor small subunit
VTSVVIHYHGLLRRVTGLAQETLELAPGTTLRHLLQMLADEHEDRLREAPLTEGKSAWTQVVVFRNEALVGAEEGDTILAEGDEVGLFPRVSGG